MEQLRQLPLNEVQKTLIQARNRLRRDPANRDVQSSFIATYKAVDEEFSTPERQSQLIDFAVDKYKTALPEVVAGKQLKIEEIARIQSLLKSEGLTEIERQQLQLVRAQLLEPKGDLLEERALYTLATLPEDMLQATYQRIQVDEAERVKKETRNTSRVVQLTRIVKDMTDPSLTHPIGWEEVTLELVVSDAVLEQTLYENYAGDIFKLWSEDENLTPRFQAAIDAIRFKLRDHKSLTLEEQALIDTLRSAYSVPMDQIEVAFENLLNGENGLLRAWKDREINIVEQEFSLASAPAIDLDLLAERVRIEHVEASATQSSAEEQARREIEAAQQDERHDVPETEEVGVSATRRLEKDMIVESNAKEIASLIELHFPEYIKSDSGIPQDVLMRKSLNLPRQYHYNTNDVGRYVDKGRLTGDPSKRLFYAVDVIRLLASQLNSTNLTNNIVDRAVVELQKKQLDYRVPLLLGKIGNIITGGAFEEGSNTVNWQIVGKAKGLDRLSGFMEALASGSLSASELQRFYELKTSEFRDVLRERVMSLQRVPNNIVALLSYVYIALSYDALSSGLKGDFEKIAAKKVREMARSLETEVKAQKRTLQQDIASARTRMKARRY